MTVCIAAICDQGRRIVTATDRMLSTSDVTMESLAGKMSWMAGWQFMYAGIPANIDLVSSRIFEGITDDPATASPREIKRTVLAGYRWRAAELDSFEILRPFDMTLKEFKDEGQSVLGETFYAEVARDLRSAPLRMQDQLLVTGWGREPASAMIYEVGPSGDYLHNSSGIAVIGSGGAIALSVLMLLGQGRDSTLAETIFNVAASKFFSERSVDLAVGRGTTMFIQHKQNNDGGGSSGNFLSEENIDELGKLWEDHLRLRIPDQARGFIGRLAASLSDGKSTLIDMVETVNAVQRLKNRTSQEALTDPEVTTADQSLPQPSQESPEESGES
jgi:ATP-dependent protease HslVU (ClpYQ) peptidase subunit